MVVHVPKPKKPDPNDRGAVLLFEAEEALKKVSLFPETNREQAWGDFIALRSHTSRLIHELHFMQSERKRLKEHIAARLAILSGRAEVAAEEAELRVLADLLDPPRALKDTPQENT